MENIIKVNLKNNEGADEFDKVADKFDFKIEDIGSFYEIIFIYKKTGTQIKVPLRGNILNFKDIVAFTDGTTPEELTKQEWIDLYLKEKGRSIK